MYNSVDDVIGGFQKLIDEQKGEKNGECIISLYRFSDTVKKDYIGKPVDEVSKLIYSPGGCTAMNDGVGTAIDEIGKWLSDMDESERPSKNMIVIMTDGQENASKEYDFDAVKGKIKHQEEKYSWTFVYMGTNLQDLKDANRLGIKMRSVSGSRNIAANYSHIDAYAKALRSSTNAASVAVADAFLTRQLCEDTTRYQVENNITL
jgi:hypothetical protein